MKKVMIGLIILAVAVSGGIFAINKYNEGLMQEYTSMEKTTKVNKGDLNVKIFGSGNVEIKDEDGANLNELKIKVEVDELDINKIEIGQSVEVKVYAFPNEVFNGKVVSIAKKGEAINGVTTYSVEVSLPSLVSEVGKINDSGVGLRQGPAAEYMTIRILENGEDIKIISKKGKWYEVALSEGTIGWVYADYITEGTIDKQDVEAITLNDSISIRKGPSIDYGVITKLSKDNKVKIIDKDGNWYKVKLNNEQEGWLGGNDIAIQKIKAGMSATTSILVEEKKDTLYLPVECVKKTDEGYVVMLKGGNEYKQIKTGIITDEYIEIVEGLSVGDEVIILEDSNDSTIVD